MVFSQVLVVASDGSCTFTAVCAGGFFQSWKLRVVGVGSQGSGETRGGFEVLADTEPGGADQFPTGCAIPDGHTPLQQFQ